MTNIGRIKDISYGVLRNYCFLEAIFNSLVSKTPKDQRIKIILLIAIYEIKYTRKPVYAITNDIVEFSFSLSKDNKIKGFINAVIRNFLRRQSEMEGLIANNPVAKYNFPQWWIDKLTKDYPEQSKQILVDLNHIPKMNLRVIGYRRNRIYLG